MTQPAQQAEPEPPRTVRDPKRDKQESRLRGARRGLLARYALRNLPPLEEDEP
jgi:hypothetical protein